MVYCGSEANCTRQPVSLFPHSGMMKRGGNKKKTTFLVVLASDTNISYETTLSVYSPDCHDITRSSLRNEVVCNSTHHRFNDLINEQWQAAKKNFLNFFARENITFTCLPQCGQSCIRGTCYNTLHAHVMSHDSSCSCDVSWLFMLMQCHMTLHAHVMSHDSSCSCNVTWLFMLMWCHTTLHAHVMSHDSHSHIVYPCEMYATTLCWSWYLLKQLLVVPDHD